MESDLLEMANQYFIFLLVAGSLTFYFENPKFLYWKPTVFYWVVGAAFLAATGVTAPDAGANPWWIIPVKSLIWPAAGHAIAGYIEHRTQRNLQAGLVWISRSQPAFPKTSN